MILDDLISFLRDRGEIAAITGDQIRPGVLSQTDANQASIRLAMISSPSEHDLSGPSGIVGERIQIDLYARGYAEVLAEKVRLAMYDFPGPYGDESVRTVRLDNQSDSTEKIDDAGDNFRFRVRQDWLVWHTEAVPA